MIKENSENKFLGGKLSILQQKEGFRAGHDSVLLASAIPAKKGDKCLELGIGTGVVSLCLLKRVPDLFITGIDNDREVLELLKKNITLNGYDNDILIIEGDLNADIDKFKKLKRHSFDHIFCNPPFYEEGEIVLPKDKNKRNAYQGEKNFIESWIKFSLTFVKSRGSITFINHIKNLPDVLSFFSKSMGDINVTPIFTHIEKPATRFLIKGIRDSRRPIKIRKGLILNTKNGKTPKKIENILRYGKAL
tara:strand:+ start:668 stop:1411 length:744 start_codon:yes stop_codon:yes gene_type:complete